MRIFPPTKIFISDSPIHGVGVFANTFIKSGEVFEICPILDLKIPKGVPDNTLTDYRFNWPQGTNDWEKQVVAWGWGSLYNHSNEANAGWRSNLGDQTFEFYALRDINPYEEILVYYGGVEYWNDGRNHTIVK
jgi:SET domain-containing protein